MTNKIMMKVPSINYEWILLAATLFVLNIYCTSFAFNSDTLFPFRYADAIHSPGPIKLFIQPGPRFFPEWVYAYLIRFFTDKASQHLLLMMVLNSIVLTICMVTFCTLLFKNKSVSMMVTSFSLLSIPTMNVFFSSDIQYLIFSPGIHGFSLPFLILSLYFCLKLLSDQRLKSIEYMIFFLIMLLTTISNQLLLISLIGPMITSIIVVKIIFPKALKLNTLTIFFVMTLIVVLISLKANLIWNLTPHIYINPGNQSYFQEPLNKWLSNQGMNFFSNFFDIKRTGVVWAIVCVSLLLSIFKLSQAVFNKNATPELSMLFINTINLVWWPFIMVALWAINKGLIRYIPYIFLMSPLILIINLISSQKKLKSFILGYSSKFLLLLLCLLTLISFPYKHDNFRIHDNSSFHSLMIKLKTLQGEKVIGDTGLSAYWVAWSGTSDYGFNILPIHESGSPNVFASNALSFWDFNDESKKKRRFSFAINRFLKHTNKWSLNKVSLEKNFGPISKVISYTDDRNRDFEIYIFNEIKSDFLYNTLETKIARHFFD